MILKTLTLINYRKFKNELQPEKYLNLNISRDQRSAFAKLRCGVLPIEVETGRYRNTPLQQRTCKICDSNQVEDEVHFLINCPAYTDIRANMITKARETDEQFIFLDEKEQAYYLLSNDSVLTCVIKTVDKMFYKRKQLLSK